MSITTANSDAHIGQWIGELSGTNSAYMMLNVDRDKPNQASVQVNDDRMPFSAACLLTVTGNTVKGKLIRFTPFISPVPEGIRVPQSGEFIGKIDGDSFTGTWETDVQTHGQFTLYLREARVPRPPDAVMSWKDFRVWCLEEDQKRPSLIFRGHDSARHPLVTSFHRTGRRNLLRYDAEDVPRLCRFMEGLLNTTYDIRNPVDYGCLLNLAPHHGFPTPLLDWTESPFVAAFFAFSVLPRTTLPKDSNVRVFVFNPEGWLFGGVPMTIGQIGPSFARLDLSARHNARVLPQQSVHQFSNLVDIESFIEINEEKTKRTFLRRVDIPASERSVAMRELDSMGVTAASMFPGIEGLCHFLREKYF